MQVDEVIVRGDVGLRNEAAVQDLDPSALDAYREPA